MAGRVGDAAAIQPKRARVEAFEDVKTPLGARARLASRRDKSRGHRDASAAWNARCSGRGGGARVEKHKDGRILRILRSLHAFFE
eukprot:4099116-Pleurochrysis_carterae.AAC.2